MFQALFKGYFFPGVGPAIACRYGCGNGGEGSLGGAGSDSAVNPQSMGGVRGGEEGHTHTHTYTHTHRGTYTRMLHPPFSDLPFKKCPIVARGLLQGRPLQLPMGWGVGKELTKT